MGVERSVRLLGTRLFLNRLESCSTGGWDIAQSDAHGAASCACGTRPTSWPGHPSLVELLGHESFFGFVVVVDFQQAAEEFGVDVGVEELGTAVGKGDEGSIPFAAAEEFVIAGNREFALAIQAFHGFLDSQVPGFHPVDARLMGFDDEDRIREAVLVFGKPDRAIVGEEGRGPLDGQVAGVVFGGGIERAVEVMAGDGMEF